MYLSEKLTDIYHASIQPGKNVNYLPKDIWKEEPYFSKRLLCSDAEMLWNSKTEILFRVFGVKMFYLTTDGFNNPY